MTDDQYEQIGVPGCIEAVLIGSGGFGRVYKATQPAFGRKVAVKVLTGSLRDEKIRDRFERECHALGQASVHPNIVDVFDAGATEDDNPYMVMPFVKKGSYADRIASTGPIGWAEATRVGVKMAAALHTAHELGVLHRDIKPENILRSEFGEPMLADFGIARLEGAKETQTGSVTASIAYAAPEVLAAGKAGVMSDVYSLASAIHAMILGRPPFWQPDEDSLLPMLNRISTAAPPNLRTQGVPDQVVRVLERGLAKKPDDRPPSAEAFGRALAWAQAQCGMTPTELVIHIAGDDDETMSGPRVVAPAPLASLASTSLPKPDPTRRRDGPPPTGSTATSTAAAADGSSRGPVSSTSSQQGDPSAARSTGERPANAYPDLQPSPSQGRSGAGQGPQGPDAGQANRSAPHQHTPSYGHGPGNQSSQQPVARQPSPGPPPQYPTPGPSGPWQGGAPPAGQQTGWGQPGYTPQPTGWQQRPAGYPAQHTGWPQGPQQWGQQGQAPGANWGRAQGPLPAGGQRVPTIPNEFPVPAGAVVRRANAPAGAAQWWVEWVMPSPLSAVATFYGAFFSSDPYGLSVERPLGGNQAQVQGVFVSMRSRTRYQVEIRLQDNATVVVVAGARF